MTNQNNEEEIIGVIPKPPTKSKLRFGITFKDIGVVIIALIVGGLICFSIPSFGNLVMNIVVRAIIVLIILIIFLIPLLPLPTVGHEVRLYNYLWWAIAFKWIDKKVYEFEQSEDKKTEKKKGKRNGK